MIRIRHLALPPGLSALLRQTSDGDLEILLSDALDPRGQRAALRVALQSSRRAGWRAGLLPIPVMLLLAAGRSGIRAASRALRVHAVASAAAAGVVAASAAALIVALPHHHAPLSASRLPSAGRVHAPAPSRTTNTSPHRARSPRPGLSAPSHPRHAATPASIPSAVVPSPVQKSATATPSASPAPGITSSSPTATPTTSQPPSNGGQPCLVLLGIWVCL
jgi:hypothetical protein